MEIKLLGALLIFCSGSTMGWMIASQYLKRIEELHELQVAISIFDTEVNYGQTMLPGALEFTAQSLQDPLSRLFSGSAEALDNSNGLTFARIWSEQLKKYSHRNSLRREDVRLLEEWGRQVGHSSLANQSKINRITIKRLEQAENQAREIAGKRVKLIKYSGVLVSLMVIILLY